MHFELGSRLGWGSRHADPWHSRLALVTCNVTSLVGKELELEQEVEQYQLDTTGLWKQILERGGSLAFSRVAHGKRCRAGVGILTSLWLSATVLKFSPGNESPLCDCKLLKRSLMHKTAV